MSSVFSAFLWLTISRGQSHPIAAPAALCLPAAAAGSQRVPKKQAAAPAPRLATRNVPNAQNWLFPMAGGPGG